MMPEALIKSVRRPRLFCQRADDAIAIATEQPFHCDKGVTVAGEYVEQALIVAWGSLHDHLAADLMERILEHPLERFARQPVASRERGPADLNDSGVRIPIVVDDARD